MLLGVTAGIITGLIPGIHINLVAMVLLVNFGLLIEFLSIQSLIIFIIVMGTVHSFVDFIPSVLFGVPSSDTALSVLPAHQLVLEGHAYKAIFLSSAGSLSGVFFSLAIMPLFYFGLEKSYAVIKPFIPFILLVTLSVLIFMEKGIRKKILATIVVLFSGALGMLILNSTITDQSLLLLFTGLFGISSIFYALIEESSDLPPQQFSNSLKYDWTFFKAIAVGGVSSTLCSVSPGLGNAQAGTLAALFFRKIESEIFILVVSAINTINFILSFMTLYIIDRARNGAVFVIAQITDMISFQELLFYVFIITLISIVGFLLTLFLGKRLILITEKLNFKIINLAIMIFLLILISLMTGAIGLLILFCASTLGILCLSLNVRRVHMMAILLLPVIINLL